MQSRLILRMLSEPILVLDSSLRAILANPAFYDILKIPPGELEGKSVKDLLVAKTGQQRLRAILQMVVSRDSNVNREELECVIPPDTRKIFSVSARQVIADDDQTKMVLVELRDVTGERDAERRLQELNAALTRHGADLERANADLESFTRWISHDLRTPLRFIDAVARQLLQGDGVELPVAARESAQMIVDCTRDMAKLVENLLAFAHVGIAPLKKRRMDLGQLAREAAAELMSSTPDRCVNIVIDEVPPCHADRALLKQVLLNLLANALTFTQPCERAKIWVGFTQLDGVGVYFVRDNGEGFDMSEADSLFLPFYRLHKKDSLQGTGVGLSLVKRIIDRHGGRIWAEGKPACGATFYFQLSE